VDSNFESLESAPARFQAFRDSNVGAVPACGQAI
jgi:hypothetical protein